MRKVELQLLAKDFEETSYFDIDDCAITRALRRAGLEGYREIGGLIDDGNGKIMSVNEEEREELSVKVQRMYGFDLFDVNLPSLEPEDFTHTLTFNDLDEV